MPGLGSKSTSKHKENGNLVEFLIACLAFAPATTVFPELYLPNMMEK